MCSGKEDKWNGWGLQSLFRAAPCPASVYQNGVWQQILTSYHPQSLGDKDCALLKSVIDRQPNNFPLSCKPMRFIDIHYKPTIWKQAHGFQKYFTKLRQCMFIDIWVKHRNFCFAGIYSNRSPLNCAVLNYLHISTSEYDHSYCLL